MGTDSFFVYIMSTVNNKVIYVGFSNDIKRRVYEHQSHLNFGFTWRYNICKLVYYEPFKYVDEAIKREKQLKRWNRDWKDNLINKSNPGWNDITSTL